MVNRVLIDAGPLVAILSEADQYHARCLEAAKALPETLFTCWPVLTEAAYLLRKSPIGMDALISRLQLGRLELLPLDASDVTGIGAILAKYRDQNLQLADACLMHLCNRETINTVFTLDQRDFVAFRTHDGNALHILPAP